MSKKNEVEARDYADDIGVIGVPLSIAKQVMQLCWHDGHVPLLIGESGTGKTAAVHQLAELNDMSVTTFSLGNVDSTDIRGPMWPREDGTFSFLKNADIPMEWTASVRQDRILKNVARQGITLEKLLSEDFDYTSIENLSENELDTLHSIVVANRHAVSKAVLFFDEANRGNKDAMNAVFSVWAEHRLGDGRIGPNVRVAGAMNPPGGTYAVNSQFSNDPAMRRRVCQIVVHFSNVEFLRYAADPSERAVESRIPALDYSEFLTRDRNRPYHKAVLEFLKLKPDVVLDTKARESGKVYGCPPNWAAISDTMYTVERLSLDMDDPVISRVVTTKLSGHVGYQVALDFLEHYNKVADVIDPVALLYNYKNKSKTWRQVQKAIADGEHLRIVVAMDLAIRHIYTEMEDDTSQFKLEDVMPQVGRLVNDIPANIAQEVMALFATVSTEMLGEFSPHTRKAMNILLKDKNFNAYVSRSLELSMKSQEQTE